MSEPRTKAPLPASFYRLHAWDERFFVDRVDRDLAGLNQFQDIAVVNSRESAMAVFRLFEVTEIHDWTSSQAHWGMPMTRLVAA